MAENHASEYRPIEELDRSGKKLASRALKMRKKAYAPYSKYRVGCALIDSRKKIHTGCNVENACYSAAICAERVALSKMVSRGSRECLRIAVATSSDDPVFPCGFCLQVLAEFGPDSSIIAVNSRGSLFHELPLRELYPKVFSKRNLV